MGAADAPGVRAHLETCGSCGAVLAAERELIGRLASAAGGGAPVPPGLGTRIAAAVRAEAAEPDAGRVERVLWARSPAWAAAACAAALLLVWAAGGLRRPQGDGAPPPGAVGARAPVELGGGMIGLAEAALAADPFEREMTGLKSDIRSAAEFLSACL